MLGQLVDGMDFYSTIVDMGEEITFLTDPPIKQYASITMHRTTNTTDGAYWYYGAMTFDSVEQQNTLVGEYFTRQTNSGPKNILTSVMPENTTPRVGTVYTVECNETVDIISHYEGTLPAKTTISEQNIVLKNSFIFDEKQKKNVYQQVKYRVESIDTSMMDVVDGKIVGVLKCLLTEDKR